jgi:DNA-binding transcriptional ArsR family regulator
MMPILGSQKPDMLGPHREISMDIDVIHKALANPVRRQILNWLKDPHEHFAQQEHPLDLGVCAGLIDARTGLSQSTVSAHLATLQRASLVTSRRVGQWIFFKRNEDTINAFLDHINHRL